MQTHASGWLDGRGRLVFTQLDTCGKLLNHLFIHILQWDLMSAILEKKKLDGFRKVPNVWGSLGMSEAVRRRSAAHI